MEELCKTDPGDKPEGKIGGEYTDDMANAGERRAYAQAAERACSLNYHHPHTPCIQEPSMSYQTNTYPDRETSPSVINSVLVAVWETSDERFKNESEPSNTQDPIPWRWCFAVGKDIERASGGRWDWKMLVDMAQPHGGQSEGITNVFSWADWRFSIMEPPISRGEVRIRCTRAARLPQRITAHSSSADGTNSVGHPFPRWRSANSLHYSSIMAAWKATVQRLEALFRFMWAGKSYGRS